MMGLEKQERLRSFILSFNDKPCVWGKDDCTAVAASWIKSERGIDVGLPAYRSQGEAARIIARAGSLVALWDQYLCPVGIYEAHEPKLGDVGVIETSRGPAGVIFSNFGVAHWRGLTGMQALWPRPATILKVWSV